MTYAEYKALSDEERADLEWNFQKFNRVSNQRARMMAQNHLRIATPEEKERMDSLFAKEKARFESSMICGGIDSDGGYTALHYRWFCE